MLTVLLSLNESVSSSVGKCSNRLGTRALAKGSGVVQRDSRCVSHRWNLRPHFRHTGSGHRILISQIPTDSYRFLQIFLQSMHCEQFEHKRKRLAPSSIVRQVHIAFFKRLAWIAFREKVLWFEYCLGNAGLHLCSPQLISCLRN